MEFPGKVGHCDTIFGYWYWVFWVKTKLAVRVFCSRGKKLIYIKDYPWGEVHGEIDPVKQRDS